MEIIIETAASGFTDSFAVVMVQCMYEPTQVVRGRLEQCYVLNTQQKAGIMMIISTLIY